MLPNLLIIGAAKSGTTSLHEYLGLHPEIAMSASKELNFFSGRKWPDQVDWYESRFREPAPVRGESSPSYTMFPFMPAVAERIHELIPDAKLIYVVRDPIERAVANYVELFALHMEDRPIEQALGAPDEPANPHICPSRYATQLEIYLDHFDLDQILVIDLEDLSRHRAATLRRIFRFLRVDETFSAARFSEVHNPGVEKVRYNDLGRWLVNRRIGTNRRGPFEHPPLVAPLRRLLSRPIETTIPASVRDRLAEELRPEVERLRVLCGQAFDWPSFPLQSATAGSAR